MAGVKTAKMVDTKLLKWLMHKRQNGGRQTSRRRTAKMALSKQAKWRASNSQNGGSQTANILLRFSNFLACRLLIISVSYVQFKVNDLADRTY